MYKAEVFGKGGIVSKVVADSIANGVRLTTVELKYPRFIHSELMTHRVFSRNASSSRAIPVKKMLDQVKNDPAMPIHWGKNQPGMQAREELSGNDLIAAKDDWILAARNAASIAKRMDIYGAHKQIVNRLLEPFQFIHVVVTSTEWDNWFHLRAHPAAQPEINELANVMLDSMNESSPVELRVGQWHLPYIEDPTRTIQNEYNLEEAIRCSTARCARTSYKNHDKSNPEIEKDIDLYNALVTRPYTMKNGLYLPEDDPIHASPTEHQATPMRSSDIDDEDNHNWMNRNDPGNSFTWDNGITHVDRSGTFWSGNFRGWTQHRQLL